VLYGPARAGYIGWRTLNQSLLCQLEDDGEHISVNWHEAFAIYLTLPAAVRRRACQIKSSTFLATSWRMGSVTCW
jgi:hypothetical protein